VPGRAGAGGRIPLGGRRCFQAAKNETGLDDYKVRRYDAWYGHITLSRLAHVWLAVLAAHAAGQATEHSADPAEASQKETHWLWTTPATRPGKTLVTA
jgi:hypothetical protein